MIVLAFDTSSDRLSLALLKDGRLVQEMHATAKAAHSSALIPAMQEILKKNKLSLKKIDVLAVGLGPGSFTGLRIGIVTAKILGYALDKKIVGISSLEAIARAHFSAEHPRIAVLMDARKSKVYGACFERKHGKVRSVRGPGLWPETEGQRLINSGWFGVGNVLGLSFAPDKLHPRAGHIAQAGYEQACLKKFITPEKLDAQYLHERDCNVTLKGKQS